ncbi:MAG: DUF364 domain-containing protein [Symbiobacteriaceae bacterium]|nr:DUF364 domain-containing protein [Symbiobacteriaceae bacterium]
MKTTSKILEAALPTLANRYVKDMVFGLSLIVVELDDGALGTALLLIEELCTCSAVYPIAVEALGTSAADIANWALHTEDAVRRAVGFAVINAAANYQIIPGLEIAEARDAVQIRSSDMVGMIGNIHALNQTVKDKAARLIIFDRGAPGEGIELEERQAELLPQCDLVLITGSSFLNESFEDVVSLCHHARELWLIGPSTPLYPQAFAGLPVTHLAGTLWLPEHKEALFRAASLGAATRDVGKYTRKVTLKLES